MAWRRIDVHRAAERGDVAVIERYLDTGGDVERKDSAFQATPVHWASLGGKVKALSLLLDAGAELEARTGTHGTPLLWGCMGGHPDVIRHLLQRGANVAAVTRGKGTALHHAAAYGHVEAVKMLLEKGASPYAEDNAGHRPGDKFDAQVSQGVRRRIAVTLAKARGDAVPGKSLKLPNSTAPAHTVRNPALDLPSSSKHQGIRNGGELTPRLGKSPAERPSEHGGGRGHSGLNLKEDSRNFPGAAGLPSGPAGLAGGGPASLPTTSLLIVNGRGSNAGGGQHGVSLEGPDQSPECKGNSSYASSKSVAGTCYASKETDTSRCSPSCSPGNAGLEQYPANQTGGAIARRGSDNLGIDRANAAAPENPSHHTGAGMIDATSGETRHASWPPTPHHSGPVGVVRHSEAAAAAAAAAAATATVSTSPEAQAELVDLRRQLAGLETAAWTAAERESQGRSAAREALKDAAARAEEFGRAERARSEKLGALVKALEKRLAERDGHVARLQGELEDKDMRLRQAEQEVAALRARVNELEQGNGTQNARGDGVPTLAPVTPSPHLGGRDEGRLRAVPSPSSGVEHSTPGRRRRALSLVASESSTSGAKERRGFFDDEARQSGDNVAFDKRWEGSFRGGADGGMRRGDSDVGRLGSSEESGAANKKGEDVGVVEWWGRSGWPDNPPGPPASPAGAKKSDSSEARERLGSLYSMIARR